MIDKKVIKEIEAEDAAVLNQKEIKKLSIWLTVIIVSIIIIVVCVVCFIQRADRRKKFEGFYNYLVGYMDERFPDRYELSAEGNTIFVYVWEPGASLYLTMNKALGEIELRDRYQPLAEGIYKDMRNRGLDYGVCLVLKNDLDTEKYLMYWTNGKFQEGVYTNG